MPTDRCEICHRSLPEGIPTLEPRWCDECRQDFREVSTGDGMTRAASWAAERAWQFAGAEVSAALAEARRGLGVAAGYTPGDPGPSRVRMRRRR